MAGWLPSIPPRSNTDAILVILGIGVAFEATRAHGPNNCYLKYAAGRAVTQTYSMDGAYSAPTPESNACVNEVSPYISHSGLAFELHCGLDYAGGDMTGYHKESLDGCMDACAAYGSACVAVAYEASLAHGWVNCYLKSAITQPTQQAFVVHGARVVGTSSFSSLSQFSASSATATPTSLMATGSILATQTLLGATPGPASNTRSSGSTIDLKVGLGVGIPLAFILAAVVGIMVLLKRRRRAAEREILTAPVAGAAKVEGRFWGGGAGTVPIGMVREEAIGDRSAIGGGGAVVGSTVARRGAGIEWEREELDGRDNQIHELASQGQYRG